MQEAESWSEERCVALARALQCIAELHDLVPDLLDREASLTVYGHDVTLTVIFAGLLCMVCMSIMTMVRADFMRCYASFSPGRWCLMHVSLTFSMLIGAVSAFTYAAAWWQAHSI